MSAIFYKKLFEIQLYHENAPAVLSADFGLEPTMACRQLLYDYRMTYRTEPGKLTVYYSGDVITDDDEPLTRHIQVQNELLDGTEFVFSVALLNQGIIRQTVVPDKTTISVTDNNKAIPWHFIKPALVALQFAETAQTSANEKFTVLNNKNEKIHEAYVLRDDDGRCSCTIDLSFSKAGVFSFGVASDNSLTQKFYVDTAGELAGYYGFLRVVKDNTWLMPDAISPPPAMPDYNIFQYTFEKL